MIFVYETDEKNRKILAEMWMTRGNDECLEVVPALMLDDEIVKNPLCPICKKPMTEEDKLLHSKGQRYTRHFVCKKHGDMLLSLKLHRNFNETWRARRTIKPADEAALAEYREGIEKANVKRKTVRRRRHKPRRTNTEG